VTWLTVVNVMAAVSPLSAALWSQQSVFWLGRHGGLRFWRIGRLGGSIYWRRRP
jgi:hypothetical protein